MGLLLPNLQPPNTLAGGISDPRTAAAVRSMETWATALAKRLAGLDVSAGGTIVGGVSSVTAGLNLTGGGVGAVTLATVSNPVFTAVTVSSMTAGSILFAGSGGLLSQDNANLFWDDTNNRLGIGTTSPQFMVDLRSTEPNVDVVQMRNTNTSGYSSTAHFSSAGALKVGFGYGNSAVPDTTVRNLVYWKSKGDDIAIVYGATDPTTIAQYISATTGNVGFGTSSPALRLDVVANQSAASAMRLQNLSGAGYSAIDVYNAAGTFKMALGHDSAGNKTYLYSPATDFTVYGASAAVTHLLGTGADAAFIELTKGDSAAVSNSNTGRRRYNVSQQRFQQSLNGGAYVNEVTGSGTNNVLPRWSGTTGALADSGVSDDGSVIALARRATLTNTDGSQHSLAVTFTPSATTSADKSAFYASVGGTADTTAGAFAVDGFNVDITTTRSAGTNNLIIQGVRSFASGGQDVRAGRFGATGGTVQSAGIFATSSATATTNYGVLTQVTSAGGTTNSAITAQSTATGTNNYGVNSSATGVGTNNIAGQFTATGAGANYAVITAAGDNYLNTSSGLTAIGYATGSASSTFKLDVNGAARFVGNATVNGNATVGSSTSSHSINGWAIQSATHTTANNALQIGYTPVASTNGQSALRVLDNGTFDTTAGALSSWAIRATASATRSAGANNLVNVAGEFDASGAQSNIALRTLNGSVLLNATSGTTTVGFSSATAGALAVSGAAAITSTNNTTHALNIARTPSAGTSNTICGILTSVGGTMDTTAAGLFAIGGRFDITTTRSAGANDLSNVALWGTVSGTAQSTWGMFFTNSATGTNNRGLECLVNGAGTTNYGALFNVSGATTNYGARFTATGGTNNYACVTVDGTNYFNTSSGSSGFGYAIGATLPRKLSVTGDVYVSTTLEIDGALDHDGTTLGLFAATPATQQTITGSRASGAALADLLTKLALYGLIIDGTTP